MVALAVVILAVIAVKASRRTGTPLSGGLPSGHTALAFAGWTAVTFVVAGQPQGDTRELPRLHHGRPGGSDPGGDRASIPCSRWSWARCWVLAITTAHLPTLVLGAPWTKTVCHRNWAASSTPPRRRRARAAAAEGAPTAALPGAEGWALLGGGRPGVYRGGRERRGGATPAGGRGLRGGGGVRRHRCCPRATGGRRWAPGSRPAGGGEVPGPLGGRHPRGDPVAHERDRGRRRGPGDGARHDPRPGSGTPTTTCWRSCRSTTSRRSAPPVCARTTWPSWLRRAPCFVAHIDDDARRQLPADAGTGRAGLLLRGGLLHPAAVEGTASGPRVPAAGGRGEPRHSARKAWC